MMSFGRPNGLMPIRTECVYNHVQQNVFIYHSTLCLVYAFEYVIRKGPTLKNQHTLTTCVSVVELLCIPLSTFENDSHEVPLLPHVALYTNDMTIFQDCVSQ